jgi:hypothetical protein
VKIPQAIIDEHSFNVVNKETGDLRKAIYADHFNHTVLVDACYVWVNSTFKGEGVDSTNGWFWWTEEEFKNTFNSSLGSPQHPQTYITRYVVDIAWENVNGFYGDEGNTDCGTVMALDTLLQNAVADGSLNIDGVKAVKADWLCYVTNAKHPTPPDPIQGGKGLHPKLRESKGLWNK